MKIKYAIHRIGTPKIALPNNWTYSASEYWSSENGWGYKSTATIFEDKEWNLPEEGEWVDIYVESK